MPKRAENMSDLARIAGVSVSTVSRALAGNELIKADTRERIMKLARDHGFHPNMLARNLRLKRTQAIGVILPLGHQADQHLTDPFFLTLIGYLADSLADRGFDMLLRKVVPVDDLWLDQIVTSGRVDGVIVIGQSNQAAAINRVAQGYCPLVVWGARLQKQDYVTVGSDNVGGGAMATRHLIAKGCKRLLFLGDDDAPEIAQRKTGFDMACAEAGLGNQAHSIRVGLVADTAYQELLGAISGEPQVDGIVAASDVIAIAAIRALGTLGRTVPEHVSVVGFDDVPISQHVVPPLTTVAQDLCRGADLLVSKLMRLIAGETVASEQMPPVLIQRRSA